MLQLLAAARQVGETWRSRSFEETIQWMDSGETHVLVYKWP
jgi:hypothetical protein